MKFRLRFLIIFLSLIFIPGYFLANILIKKSEDIVLGNFVNRMAIIADIEKSRILENIEKNMERLSGITSRTQLRRTLKTYLSTQTLDDKKLMTKILSDARSSISDFEQVFIFDPRGDLICSATGDMPKDFDLKAIIGQGMKANLFTVDEDLSKQKKILLAGPLLLDNELLGVVVIVSKPNSIAEIALSFESMGKTGEILIAKRTKEGDAQFIAPRRFENDPGAKEIVGQLQENVPIIQALRKNEKSFVHAFDYRGKDIIAATRYIEPTDWGLVVKYDRDEALGPIKDMVKVFWGIASILFVFILIIALIVAISIAQPIEHMAEVANKIKNGHLKTKVEDSVRSLDDEIGELARTFDGMTTQLINFNTELDAQVKEKTKALRESEQHYRSLFNSIDEGFCIVEMIYDKQDNPVDFRYLQVNPSFDKQSGLTDVQGKRIRELVPQLESDWFEIFGKIALTGESARFENRAEELHRWYDVYAFRFGEPENRQVAILFKDITERKRAQVELSKKTEELARSNKELEQFAYVASHDLQEPLRMVTSFTQKLERKYMDMLDADGKEYIFFVVDGAKRMQILIDDLLTFSRVGQKDVPFVRIDINLVCKAILEDLDILIKENEASVQLDTLPVFYANDTQMMQLFSNLISNAIKYRAQKPPVIKITSREIEENQWQFSVSDNGIGIEEKYFDKLFVIFKRLHTRTKYKGTGIGLALCKKIVENYDGRIWIESKINEGTTFHFTLKGREKNEAN